MICPGYTEPLYFFYVSDLPRIIYYAYFPAIIVAAIAGAVVLWNDRKSLLNRLLFAICASFLVWTLSTLVLWTNIHSGLMLFFWSLLGPAAGFISIFSVYFAHVFLERRDAGRWMKLAFIVLLAPLIALAASPYTLKGFNLVNCDAFGLEGPMNTIYFPALGVLAMLWIAVLLIRKYRKADVDFRKEIVIMGTGIELFLFSFFTTEFLGQYLTTVGFLPDSQVETYGYFGMIVFVVYISVLIVRFKAFHVNLIASQLLTAALLVLIATQFTYTKSTTNILLNSVALILTAIIGFVLIRSTQREIQQRQRIEKLAKDLEQANKQQVSLIHFITHQLKGFVAKSRNIFSMIQEGDFGPVPEQMQPMISEGFSSATKGAETIQDILNAANIKSGAVAYAHTPYDFKELLVSAVKSLKPAADAKGLALSIEVPKEPVPVIGDQMQMENAIRNLIDNSIKYTPKGSVAVSLTRDAGDVRLVVQDTGVGITAEDMEHLFTEGGHGKDSQKVNVDSTGFGLYIVKNIIEAHKGKVWAESSGAGKGSRFIVDIPSDRRAIPRIENKG